MGASTDADMRLRYLLPLEIRLKTEIWQLPAASGLANWMIFSLPATSGRRSGRHSFSGINCRKTPKTYPRTWKTGSAGRLPTFSAGEGQFLCQGRKGGLGALHRSG